MSLPVVSSDVLVIGGGEAALRAAIEAHRQGAQVLMVSKGKIGSGGSSAISDTVHSAILADGDSPDIFYQDMMRGGKQINKRELVRALTEDCTARVQELVQEFKVELNLDRDLITPGHSFPRRCFHKDGAGIAVTRKLREYAEKIGVHFQENVWIVDLLDPQGDGRICGAIGLVEDEWVLFAAGSTILASGGVGRIFANSDNPVDITGEATGIAWRHGVQLQDMEFVQFYPYRLVSPLNMDLYTKLFGVGAIMRNEQGERFLEKYPRKELETRDVVCYQMFKEEKVLLDISQVSEADLQKITPRLHSLLAKGYQGELVAQPVEHYSIGGISIDPCGRTNRKGLYACGECTGGVHGANRLGGGALTESVVFGTRAGLTAAQEAALPSQSQVERWLQDYSLEQLAFLRPGDKQVSKEIRHKVQATMWKYVGIEREEPGLQKASQILSSILEEERHCQPLLDMVEVSRLITQSALVRKESRGAHQRADFPETNVEWQGNLLIQGSKLEYRPHSSTNQSCANSL